MKKRMARVFAVMLCVSMIVGAFSACTGDGGSSAPSSSSSAAPETSEQSGSTAGEDNTTAPDTADSGETLWQTMIVATNAEFKLNSDMWIFQQLEEIKKMNFNIEIYANDQWTERKNLMFAANELPDVLAGSMTPSEVITYSKAGQIVPLSDLLAENAPNYMANLDKYPDGAKLYAPDGQMYGISSTFTGGSAETPGARCFINTNWAQAVGKEMPATYDEFYELLVAFRDSDPKGNGETVYPLSGVGDINAYQSVDPFVANPLGIQMSNSKKSMFQSVDGKIEHLINMPIYEEYLTKMNQLYSEKLLDNEYYTQNEAQFRAKGANMLLGAYTDHAHFLTVGSTEPELYDQYQIPVPLTSEHQSTPVWYGDVVAGASIFITSVNQNPDRSIDYLDYFWTEEGCELVCGPVEGEWDGAGGIVWNAEKTSFTYDIPEGFNGIWDWLCKEVSTVSFLQGNMQYSDIKAKEQKSPEDASFKDQMEKNVAPYVIPDFPQLFFTTEEQEQITLILNDVTTYFNQMEAKMVMGEVPVETGIQETRTYLESIGLADLISVYQAAYDRYSSNI